MGTPSPSTVTSPFNQSTFQTANQTTGQVGSMNTAGATAQDVSNVSSYTPHLGTLNLAGELANSANSIPLSQQVPGLQIAPFNAEQNFNLESLNQAGQLGGLAGYGMGETVGAGGLAAASGMPISGYDVASFYNPMAGNVTAQLQNIFGQQNAQATGDATKTAGGVGASRIGVAQGNIANQQTLAAGQIYAGLYQNALQAAQQQKQQQLQSGMGLGQLGGASIQQGIGGLQTALGASTMKQQQEQAQLAALYQQQMGMYQQPYQRLAAQIPALQAMGVLGGTTTGQQTGAAQQIGSQQGAQFGELAATQTGQLAGQQSTQYPAPSLTSQIVGAGTAALGGLSLLGGTGGAAAGLSSIGSFFSDKRAKTDIEHAGRDAATGLNLYAFRYKKDPKTYPKVIGPMAQEVREHNPQAVTEMAKGGIALGRPAGLGRFPSGRFPMTMPKGQFMPRMSHRIPKMQSGGVMSFTPMTNIFGNSEQSKYQLRQTPPAPTSELQAITGDIQKYSKLADLYKRSNQALAYKKQEPFARVPNEPGPTEGGRFEGAQQDQQPQQQQGDSGQGGYGQQKSSGGYDEEGFESSGYQEGGEVYDETVAEPEALSVEDTGPEPLGPTTIEPADVSGFAQQAPEEESVPLPQPRPPEAPAQPEVSRVPAQSEGELRSRPPGPEAPSEPAGLSGIRAPRGVVAPRGGLAGMSGHPGMALLSAGLGMLAASGQRDARGLPMSTMGAIGQGGLMGVQTLQQQQAAAFKEQQLMEAQRVRQMQMGIAQSRMLEQMRHNRKLEEYYGVGEKKVPAEEQQVSEAPGAMVTGLPNSKDAGEIPANNALVQSGPYDYAKGAPQNIKEGMDLPAPAPVGRYGGDTIAQDAQTWLETGKLPALGSSRGPELKETKDIQAAIKNYGVALARSRGLSKEDVTEMQRTAPGMLRFILGVDGRSTVALGTAVRHLETMKELRKTWDDAQSTGNFTAWNRLRAEVGRQFGDANVTNIDNAGKIIGPEIIKALGVAGAGTHEDRQAAAAGFTPGASPAQFNGAVETVQKLLGGQLEGRKRQAKEAGVSEKKFIGLIGELPYEKLTSQEYKPKGLTTAPAGGGGLAVGTRKQFKQGWGVWDGSKWVPE